MEQGRNPRIVDPNAVPLGVPVGDQDVPIGAQGILAGEEAAIPQVWKVGVM